MTGSREAQLLDATNLLLDARRTSTPVESLPPALVPASMDEVFFIQDQIADAYGTIGGWKVGAPTPEAEPIAAPMPRAWMAPNNTTLSGPQHRLRGLEAEVAFLLTSDLPRRATPYTDEEVYAAVRSCHPAIEILESGLEDPTIPELRMAQLADLQMHGGFVFGPACAEWRSIDFSKETVSLAIDGSVRLERTGSNTSGNLLRLLPWLANAGSARTGGLFAGQWVTTGSWTGATFALSRSDADVHFKTLGVVSVRYA